MEFIKLIENEKGYTYLSYSFNYRESCNNVYKSSKTAINGKNSNITGLKKYLSKPVPGIITANTYFWKPKGDRQGRRNAENYRNGEVQLFFLSEGFTEVNLRTVLRFKNQPAGLQKGEELFIESQGGVFLRYRGHDYHFGFVKKVSDRAIEEAREAIRIRRLKDLEETRLKDQLEELKSKVFVTFNDSVKAGNCKVGTELFYNTIPLVRKGFHVRAMRADALLSLRDDSYTRRAVHQAISRHLAAI